MARTLYKKTCPICDSVYWTEKPFQVFCSKVCAGPINAIQKRVKLHSKRQHIVWSCGGGVDSVGIGALIYLGRLPKPDYAIMTDNGYDASHTWDYVNSVLIPKLKTVGVEIHIIKSSDYVDTGIVSKGQVVLPAYTSNGIEVQKLDTRCSGAWKLTVAKRWLRENGVDRCVNWVGVSADESRRVKEARLQWFRLRYPMVEMNVSRRDCKRIIQEAGWPLPLRSSCIMCPQRTDNQWLDLRDDHPGDFEKAVEIEREMHRTHPHIFLHRSLKPLDQADFVGGGDKPFIVKIEMKCQYCGMAIDPRSGRIDYCSDLCYEADHLSIDKNVEEDSEKQMRLFG